MKQSFKVARTAVANYLSKTARYDLERLVPTLYDPKTAREKTPALAEDFEKVLAQYDLEDTKGIKAIYLCSSPANAVIVGVDMAITRLNSARPVLTSRTVIDKETLYARVQSFDTFRAVADALILAKHGVDRDLIEEEFQSLDIPFESHPDKDLETLWRDLNASSGFDDSWHSNVLWVPVTRKPIGKSFSNTISSIQPSTWAFLDASQRLPFVDYESLCVIIAHAIVNVLDPAILNTLGALDENTKEVFYSKSHIQAILPTFDELLESDLWIQTTGAFARAFNEHGELSKKDISNLLTGIIEGR